MNRQKTPFENPIMTLGLLVLVGFTNNTFALDFDKELASANELSSTLSAAIESPQQPSENDDSGMKVQLISLSDEIKINHDQARRQTY